MALKDHKKGLMQQLFPREGETTPRLRFPEFRDAGEWEVKRLEALVTTSHRRRKFRPPSISPAGASRLSTSHQATSVAALLTKVH